MHTPAHRCSYRVIYGDTDNMGYAYYANYLRWFEIGRTELFRAWGVTYREMEAQGVFLPVSEAYCKYIQPVGYDDRLIIETRLDLEIKAGMKFDYRILNQGGEAPVATGFTRHPYVNKNGRVVRPPRFIRDLIQRQRPTDA
jgi:acyl-CoA thioester hydrolase